MTSIAQKLVDQVLEEKQVYLDNARLKHGVPRMDRFDATSESPQPAMTSNTSTSIRENSTVSQPVAAAPAKSSFMKTAAIVGLSAAAGAFGIPPIVSSIAANFAVKAIDPPASVSPDQKPEQPEWNDLVNWIREEGLDK